MTPGSDLDRLLDAMRHALVAAEQAVEGQKSHCETASRLSNLVLEIAASQEALVALVVSRAQSNETPPTYEWAAILAVLRDVKNAVAASEPVAGQVALAEAERRLDRVQKPIGGT